MSFSPLPGVSLAAELRCRKLPPPTNVVPDGQVAVALVAVPAVRLVIGTVVVWTVTSGRSGPAWAGAGPSVSVTTPVASTINAQVTVRFHQASS